MDVSKYAALFLDESREHLSGCNQLLLEWEREPAATEPVGGVFRSIHTIKGMAATMGYAGVAQLAHRMENLLDLLRQAKVPAGPGIFQLLFRAVDALGRAVQDAAGGKDTSADDLEAELDAVAGGETMVPAAPAGKSSGVRPVRVTLRPDT